MLIGTRPHSNNSTGFIFIIRHCFLLHPFKLWSGKLLDNVQPAVLIWRYCYASMVMRKQLSVMIDLGKATKPALVTDCWENWKNQFWSLKWVLYFHLYSLFFKNLNFLKSHGCANFLLSLLAWLQISNSPTKFGGMGGPSDQMWGWDWGNSNRRWWRMERGC